MSKQQNENAAPGEPGYVPTGEVVELSVNAKSKTRVVADDRHVWKETIKSGKKGE
ncbi:MAG TPA: hypothetical protein VFN13_08130 [Rudaea sp.]|nr:hypothetical protein [Rudaea sp.]